VKTFEGLYVGVQNLRPVNSSNSSVKRRFTMSALLEELIVCASA